MHRSAVDEADGPGEVMVTYLAWVAERECAEIAAALKSREGKQCWTCGLPREDATHDCIPALKRRIAELEKLVANQAEAEAIDRSANQR